MINTIIQWASPSPEDWQKLQGKGVLFSGSDPYTQTVEPSDKKRYKPRQALEKGRNNIITALRQGHGDSIEDALKKVYKSHLALIGSYAMLYQGGGMSNTDFFGDNDKAFADLKTALTVKLTIADFQTACTACGRTLEMPEVDFTDTSVRRSKQ